MEYNNFMVECMINDLNVTEGHRYEVYQENEKYYWIKKNRYGASSFYPKEWFKKVEEKKGLNIIEAIKMPVGTEFEVVFNDEKIENNTMIIYKSLTVDEECKHMDWKCHPQDTFMKPYDFLINGMFIPIKQPVSFMEVVNSDNKCRVEHSILKNRFERYELLINIMKIISCEYSCNQLKQILTEGKWYLE